jgi:hypothetical protein
VRAGHRAASPPPSDETWETEKARGGGRFDARLLEAGRLSLTRAREKEDGGLGRSGVGMVDFESVARRRYLPSKSSASSGCCVLAFSRFLFAEGMRVCNGTLRSLESSPPDVATIEPFHGEHGNPPMSKRGKAVLVRQIAVVPDGSETNRPLEMVLGSSPGFDVDAARLRDPPPRFLLFRERAGRTKKSRNDRKIARCDLGGAIFADFFPRSSCCRVPVPRLETARKPLPQVGFVRNRTTSLGETYREA